MSTVVLFQTIIMTKAYPRDKYVLPVAVFFWYLKSYELEEIFSFSSAIAPATSALFSFRSNHKSVRHQPASQQAQDT